MLSGVFDSGLLKGYSGATWRARSEWYPSPLISVTAEVSRSIENGGLKTPPEWSPDRWSGKLYYEVRRNLDAVIRRYPAHARIIAARISSRTISSPAST